MAASTTTTTTTIIIVTGRLRSFRMKTTPAPCVDSKTDFTFTFNEPEIFKADELMSLLTEMHNKMQHNKLDDRIVHIELPIFDSRTKTIQQPLVQNPDGTSTQLSSIPSTVVAGSAALHMYLMHHGHYSKSNVVVGQNRPFWKPTDVDLFTLHAKRRSRYTCKRDGMDNVNTMFTNVEDLLLNFDLSICRVAYCTGHLWISLQALYCIHVAGSYPVPLYFNDLLKYKRVVNNGKPKTQLMKKLITEYYYKVNGRVEKYATRGFNPEWIDTMEPVSYVKSQFLNEDSFFNTFIDYN